MVFSIILSIFLLNTFDGLFLIDIINGIFFIFLENVFNIKALAQGSFKKDTIISGFWFKIISFILFILYRFLYNINFSVSFLLSLSIEINLTLLSTIYSIRLFVVVNMVTEFFLHNSLLKLVITLSAPPFLKSPIQNMIFI